MIKESTKAESADHMTVGQCVRGRTKKWESHKWQQFFTTAAKSIIEKCCKKQDDQGVPVDIKKFTTFFNYWLTEETEREGLRWENRPDDINKNFIRHYLDRYCDLRVRYAARLDRQRALCSNPLVIMKYFWNLVKRIYEHGIKPEGIINGNEKDFLRGTPGTHSLSIVRAGLKKH